MNISLVIAILDSIILVGLGVMLVMLVRVIHELENITESLFHSALSLKVNVMKAEQLRKQTAWVQKKPVEVKRKPGCGFIIIEPPLDFPNDREE